MKSRKKKLKWFLLVAVLLLAGAGVFFAVVSHRMSLLPKMTFEQMLAYTTKDNKDAVITMGIIQDGKMSYTVYGNNAAVLPPVEHQYEIGSLTKTFTSALVCKAIDEGKLDLEQSIDAWLDLPDKPYYPTLKRLVTHTSGYKSTYLAGQMVTNFLHRQGNDYYGIGPQALLSQIGKVNLQDKDYPFEYSNFGMATVGAVLSGVYDQGYPSLMNGYIAQDLGLSHTKLSDGTGDLSGYWQWKADDAYLSAGGLVSDISDMMRYLQLQMSDELPYLAIGQKELAAANGTTGSYASMNIRIDAQGIGWMIDRENHFLWHNGGTSHFNSYAAFDKDKQLGVVILSNCPPDYRIPATVMGVRLMTALQSK